MFFKIIAHRTRREQQPSGILHTDVEASPHEPQSFSCPTEHKDPFAVPIDVALHRPLNPPSPKKASNTFTIEHIEDVMLKSEP